MIVYRLLNGESGSFDEDTLHNISVEGRTFCITRKFYGWDEYDYWFDEIHDVVEINIY